MSQHGYLIAKAHRDLEEFAKSFLPGGQAKHANRLSHLQRRGLKMELERKKKARTENPLPGLGRFSGYGTTKNSQGPEYARQMGKELRRQRRARQGLPTSSVKRSWR